MEPEPTGGTVVSAEFLMPCALIFSLHLRVQPLDERLRQVLLRVEGWS